MDASPPQVTGDPDAAPAGAAPAGGAAQEALASPRRPPPPPPQAFALVVLLVLFPLLSGLLLAWLPTGLLAVQAAGLLALFLWARATGWSIAPLLRLAGPPSARSLALGAAATVAGLLGGAGVTALTESLLSPSTLARFDQARFFTGSPLRLALTVVSAVAGAPLFEELAFRGGLLSALAVRRGAVRAALLSALVFALFHLDPVHLAGTFFLGLLYAWLALRTGSIWPSMLAHALNNLAAVVSLTAGRPDPATATSADRLAPAEAALALALGLLAWWLLVLAARRWLPPAPPLDAVLVPQAAPRTPAAAPSPSGTAPPGTAG